MIRENEEGGEELPALRMAAHVHIQKRIHLNIVFLFYFIYF
jgi:hypothetical protein